MLGDALPCVSKYDKLNIKVGVDVIRNMIKQTEIIEDQEGEELDKVQLWLFAYNGVTTHALSLIRKHQILLSTKENLIQLLTYMNLRPLPEFT